MINLLKYNPHWEKGFRYPFEKKREVFNFLLKSLSKRQIVEIVGLRRTGKTTLLFQVINHLLENKIEPFKIWYFTFDEEKVSLDELFKEFSLQTQIDFRKEKLYIFLDEIQKLPDFQAQLKVYYDLYPNLKFYLSGSTSLFIKKKIQDSLAGRIMEAYLLPLNFKEYLYFKGKSELIEKPHVFAYEIEKEFEIFLESQFIESIFITERKDRKEYFYTIMKKIVFEDIPQIFSLDNPEILWRLLKIIAQQPGILLDYQSLSKEIGISNKTLSLYLFYLEEAFLLHKVFNFSRNLITSERKLKKFYLSSPSFSWALTDFCDKGKLVENFIISCKNYKFFWRDSYKHEIDFVEVRDNQIIPVEIKYKDEVQDKELKNLWIFSKKFNCSEAIFLKKTLEEKRRIFKDLTIKELPVYLA
ncbi:MAG: ATP-binding protein [Candidatus Omnitrophica bacterium]|nr:ATP-binding protein [Candidatus Omnitrophota bacterium]